VIAVTLTGPVPDKPGMRRARWWPRGSGGKDRQHWLDGPGIFSAAHGPWPYAAAKGGVANLTRAMAVQLATLQDPGQRRGAEQDRLAGRQG